VAASTDRRIRAALLGALAVGVLLLLAALWPPTAAPDDGVPVPASTVAPETRRAPGPAPLAVRPPAPPDPDVPLAIDEIRVEKQDVCEGEENLIEVRAHSLDGTDAFLHYSIAGRRGQAVPVATYLLPDGSVPRQTISVFGRGGASISVDVPSYRVHPCDPGPALVVGYRPLPNAVDELQFEARVVQRDAAAPFRATGFSWDFGDGATASTPGGVVSHAYGHRAQAGMYSHFLVLVRAYGDSGAPLVAHTAIELLNLAWQDLEKFGTVTLAARPTPRYPSMSADGVVRQVVELWHYYPEPVVIERIHLLTLDRNGLRHDAGEVAPDALDEKVIPAGASVRARLTFDSTRDRDALAMVYRFEGTSADGRRAVGEFPVMKPPPKPTRENSVLETDPDRIARIRTALGILGTDTVSEEDLLRLEAEGRLAPAAGPR
jgi:hypothetical protein